VIFKHDLVANLPLSLLAKKNENRLILREVMGKSLVSCFFYSRCRVRIGLLFSVTVGVSVLG